MKVGELLDLLDETIGHLRVALVANQQRVFESPYTSYEFTQRAIELQEDIDDLLKARKKLEGLSPVEAHFSKEELDEFMEMLELLRRSETHAY